MCNKYVGKYCLNSPIRKTFYISDPFISTLTLTGLSMQDFTVVTGTSGSQPRVQDPPKGLKINLRKKKKLNSDTQLCFQFLVSFKYFNPRFCCEISDNYIYLYISNKCGGIRSTIVPSEM